MAQARLEEDTLLSDACMPAGWRDLARRKRDAHQNIPLEWYRFKAPESPKRFVVLFRRSNEEQWDPLFQTAPGDAGTTMYMAACKHRSQINAERDRSKWVVIKVVDIFKPEENLWHSEEQPIAEVKDD